MHATLPASTWRWDRLLWLPLAVYVGLILAVVLTHWGSGDFGAYWNAGLRMRSGEPLYAPALSHAEVYRYAPWFAFAFAPLTYLPRPVVETLWQVLLIAATALALLPLLRHRFGLVLAAVLGPWLLWTASWGNVQPLLIAALVWLLPTRWGPWATGTAASLKPFALIVVPVYLWRHDWRAVVIVLGVSAILWLPALAFDLAAYPSADRPLYWYDATWLLALPFLLMPPSSWRVEVAPCTPRCPRPVDCLRG